MLYLRALAHFARALTDPIFEFVYPPHCRGCGARIRPEDVLCPECMNDLTEFAWDEGHSARILAGLRVELPVREIRVGYLFEPKGILQECIHAAKYQGMHSIGFWFGRLLGERLVGTEMPQGDPLLIPVPLNRIKQYERGYNQSEHLCRGIAFETGLAVRTDCLARTRYTKSQAAAKLHAGEREKNVKDAFRVPERARKELSGRSVLLVDDLITTGATTGECARALLAAGCSEVRAIALAMPVKDEVA